MNIEKNPNVGQTLKSLREKKRLSMRELSTLSGLSVNTISNIERGESSPTVVSLHQLAKALKVHITELFRQEIHQFAVFVKSGETSMIRNDGVVIEGLGSGLPYQELAPFKLTIAPSGENISEPVSHSGEEFIYCLSGKLEYFVGDEVFFLEPGDRLLFKASKFHSWRNLEAEPAEIILVLKIDRGQPLPHKSH